MLFGGLIWGGSFSLARISTSEGAHPIGLTFWQALGGGLVLLVVSLVRKRWPVLETASIIRFVVVATLGTAIPGVLYFYAAANLPTGIMAITLALVPILTYVATFLLKIDPFSIGRFLGVVCGFGAMILLTQPEALPDPSLLPWLMMAFACSISYSAENMYLETRVARDVDMTCLLMGGFFCAALILIPVMIVTDAFVPIAFPFTKVEWSIFGMVIVTCISYLIFLHLVQRNGAVFASMMAYVITLAGVGWGIWLFDEQHSSLIWIALASMLGGMWLVKPGER